MSSDFDFVPIISSNEVDGRVPEKPGVYVGYNGRKGEYLRITYVGESKNLKKRLRRHEKLCTHYSYEVIEEGDIQVGNAEDVRKKRESELIEKFAPELNRSQVDGSRTLSEEWVIKFGDNALELWRRPDCMLKKGDPSFFPPERIRILGPASVEGFDLEEQEDVGSRGEEEGEAQ